MTAPSRNGGRMSPQLLYNGYSTLPHQSSFQWPSIPSSSSSYRLTQASSEEYLQLNDHSCGLSAVGITPESSGSIDQHSLFAAANSFVSAVTAMDKHVMIPNRLRDIRLPGTPAAATTNAAPTNSNGERSRHGSGQSMGAGSAVGGASLSSDCSDPIAEGATAGVNDELVDTDMYSCYRLLNIIKNELLSAANEDTECNSGESGESDTEREGNLCSITPKEEVVSFTAATCSDDTTSNSLSMALPDQSPLPHSSGSCSTQSNTSSRGSNCARRDSRRIASASASMSLPAASTDAIRQRFRLHLNGLMSILGQLTETANVMTNYYDRCLIPGGPISASSHRLNGGHSSSIGLPSNSFNLASNMSSVYSTGLIPGNGDSGSNTSSMHGDRSHILQPARLF